MTHDENQSEEPQINNGKLAPVWRFNLAVAGAIITVLIAALGGLIMYGASRMESSFSHLSLKLDKYCEISSREFSYIKERLSTHEVWMTMPHEMRVKSMERLRNHRIKELRE